MLDLGCGRGATSVFLATELSVEVVAFDLWTAEADIRQTVEENKVKDSIEVRCGDIRHQQFEDGEFDAIVSIDAFEYFGTDV